MRRKNKMAKAKKVSAAITINDNGTATITNTFFDQDGIQTSAPAGLTLSYAEGDASGSFTVTPSADTLSCVVAVVQPPPQPLAQGVTFNVTCASGLAGQTASVTVVSDPPLNVVAGPAGSFVAAVAEP
jgi:hypothetical protein